MDSAPQVQHNSLPVGDISHTGFSLAAIKIQSGSVEELEQILSSKVDRAHDAYKHTSVVLNVENVGNLNSFDFIKLQDVCRAHDLFLVGVTGVINEDRYEALVRRRIPVVNSNRYARIREENLKPKIITKFIEVKVPVQIPVPYEVKVPYEIPVPAPVRIVRRNVRSGEKINGDNASIAIYGSVSTHARVVASHHVFVFGNVNGADIFAGAPKNDQDPGLEDAIIHVQGNFNPGVISIAGNYRTGEDLDNDKELSKVCAKKEGLVITLNDGNLNYSTLPDFRN